MDWKELEDSSTADLIEYIQGRKHFYEAAECAFRAFFIRFEADLTKKCRVIAIKWGYS